MVRKTITMMQSVETEEEILADISRLAKGQHTRSVAAQEQSDDLKAQDATMRSLMAAFREEHGRNMTIAESCCAYRECGFGTQEQLEQLAKLEELARLTQSLRK